VNNTFPHVVLRLHVPSGPLASSPSPVQTTYQPTRVGFTAICNVYNETVVRERGHGSPPLAVDTLVECWSLLATLKMAQDVGTFKCHVWEFRAFASVDVGCVPIKTLLESF